MRLGLDLASTASAASAIHRLAEIFVADPQNENRGNC